MKKVDVLIIGAQKSATSSIAKNLSTLEGVYGAVKEFHYFSNESNYKKGEDWYHRAIKQECVKDNIDFSSLEILIEKSPSYMSVLDSAERIFSYNPQVKVISTLRNPVDRAFSRYQDIKIDEPGRINKSFYETMISSLKYGHHFTENGCYAKQLRPYYNLLRSEQIKVVIQEQLMNGSNCILGDIVEFSTGRKVVIQNKRVHKNSYKDEIDDKSKELLNDYFYEKNQDLFNLLGYEIPEWSN